MFLTEEQKLNREAMASYWFSDPQETQKEAEALHQPHGLFEPAAVYKTPEGKFVMGRLHARNWSMALVDEAAMMMKELIGYEMVSNCDPLMCIWKDYQPAPVAEGGGGIVSDLRGTWFYPESGIVHLCLGPYEWHAFCGHRITSSKIDSFLIEVIFKDYEWTETDKDCPDCLKCLKDAKQLQMPLGKYQAQHIKDLAALKQWQD